MTTKGPAGAGIAKRGGNGGFPRNRAAAAAHKTGRSHHPCRHSQRHVFLGDGICLMEGDLRKEGVLAWPANRGFWEKMIACYDDNGISIGRPRRRGGLPMTTRRVCTRTRLDVVPHVERGTKPVAIRQRLEQ